MGQSAKTAIGGILTGLSIIILMPTVFGIFVYALPLIASALILFSVIELGRKWAFGIYAAVSILGLLLIPNKEAVVYYVAFFGYYPIVKNIAYPPRQCQHRKAAPKGAAFKSLGVLFENARIQCFDDSGSDYTH